MRQEVGRLVHQVDPQLVVLDAGVDVHAADHHALGERLPCRGRGRCSAPCRPGAGRASWRTGGSRPRSSPCRTRARSARPSPAARSAGAGLRRRRGRPRCRPRPAPAAARRSTRSPRRSWQRAMKPSGGGGDQIAAGRVDQEIFLFDAEGQRWGGERHGRAELSAAKAHTAWGHAAVRARPPRAPPGPYRSVRVGGRFAHLAPIARNSAGFGFVWIVLHARRRRAERLDRDPFRMSLMPATDPRRTGRRAGFPRHSISRDSAGILRVLGPFGISERGSCAPGRYGRAASGPRGLASPTRQGDRS